MRVAGREEDLHAWPQLGTLERNLRATQLWQHDIGQQQVDRARMVSEQSGGEITVTSEVGSGTTFTVLLPRIDPDNAPSAEAPSVAAPKGAETILVVEDDETLRRIATRILGGAGYTVLLAATGSEGVRQRAR